ncbi:hypothetical protein ACFL1A_00875 [Patescibacteria group bacterium]
MSSDKEALHDLNTLLKQALKYKFYKKKYKNFLKHIPLKNLNDYYKLPSLGRDDFLHYIPKIKNVFFQQSRKDENNKEPIIPYTPEDYNDLVNYEFLRFNITGINKSDRVSIIDFTSNHSIPSAQSIIQNNISYVVVEGTDEEVITDIISKKISIIFTHIRFVNKLIEYIKSYNLKTSLRLVITGGEPVLNLKDVQKEIKSTLNAKYIDTIGCRQLTTYAILNPKKLAYEFIKKDQFVSIINPKTNQPDKIGNIVITPLWKKGFPLIKWDTGDMIKVSSDGSFKKIIKTLKHNIKIGTNFNKLKNIYIKANDAIRYQYFFDRLLWRIIGYPKTLLICALVRNEETLFLFIEKNKYFYTLRQKKVFSSELKKRIGAGCIVVPAKVADIYKIRSKYKYIDIRYIKKPSVPQEISQLMNKYDKSIDLID